ncbi:rhodanese-like domain-containing protein [Algoriphagus confluentis]|uniref:rhodanese-like domain-containing protein n=1 Tax=Algoriphagus confluentis TaxID=1697556 RepID=UPI0030C66ADD
MLFSLPERAIGQSLAYRTLLSGIYEKDFPLIYPDEVEDLDKFQILDTREWVEYQVSHLPGAIWVGYDTFSLENLKRIDKNKPVIVYCSVGARSQEVGKKLRSAGFLEVYNLYGGIFHWVNEENPIVSQREATDRVHTYSKTWSIWLNKGQKVY